MKKLFFLAVVMLLCAAAFAQDATVPADSGIYKLNYYANRNNSAGADQVVRLINPGTTGTPISPDEGTLNANVYVFDSTQEMQECCCCKITANGIAEISVLKGLTANPLTGFPAPNSGVIKVVSSQGKTCDPTSVIAEPLAPSLVYPELLGWMTHIQQPTSGTFVTTEDAFQNAPLTFGGGSTRGELDFLTQTCAFVLYLGSGKGSCTCAGS